MPVTEPVSIVEISSSLPGEVPVWVDVSSSLRSVKTKRGKQRQRDRSQAGTAAFTFSNADRKFDPEYTSGALYAFLKPMRRIRLRATWNAVIYPVFDGYIDFIEQGYNGPRESFATIAATDGFKRLQSAYLPSVWEATLATETYVKAWYRLDESTNDYVNVAALADRSGNGRTAYKVGLVNSVSGLLADDGNQAMKSPNTSAAGIVTIDSVTPTTLPWAIEFWIQAPRYDLGAAGSGTHASIIQPYGVTNLPGTLYARTRNAADGFNVDKLDVAVGSNGAGGILTSLARSTKSVFDNQIHHIVIVAEAGIPMKIYVDGALSTGTTVGNSQPLALYALFWGLAPLENVLDEIRVYGGTIPNAATIAAHYAIGANPWANDTPATRIGRVLDLITWPVADRALSSAGSPLQRTGLGGTALEHLLLIEETELGAVYMTADGKVRYIGRDELITGSFTVSQATFGDAIGELGYTNIDGYRLSDDMVRNTIRRNREGGAEIVAIDAASQNQYGPKTESTSGTQETNDTAAYDRANYHLGRVKDAVSYIGKLEIEPRKEAAALFPVVLGLELQSRITVKRRPQLVGEAISKEAIVQGVEHDIGPKKWQTRFYIDTSAAQKYFLFDVTLWGAPDWRFSSA